MDFFKQCSVCSAVTDIKCSYCKDWCICKQCFQEIISTTHHINMKVCCPNCNLEFDPEIISIFKLEKDVHVVVTSSANSGGGECVCVGGGGGGGGGSGISTSSTSTSTNYDESIFPCPMSMCLGFVREGFCNICNKNVCSDCREPKSTVKCRY